MRRLFYGILAVGFAMSVAQEAVARAQLSDAAVRQRMIRESVAGYPGSCPCPYNSARNGSRCGARSAYSRPGGYAPLCFPTDIPKREVEEYRHAHSL
jgi:hypothetical protein